MRNYISPDRRHATAGRGGSVRVLQYRVAGIGVWLCDREEVKSIGGEMGGGAQKSRTGSGLVPLEV